LIREGIDPAKIDFVGNVMIDTLVRLLPRAKDRPVKQTFGLGNKPHVLVTLHRPSNVDDPDVLRELLKALVALSKHVNVVFPLHPRTRRRIQDLGTQLPNTTLNMIDPLGYLDFLSLLMSASVVITDSGGIQEETTYLGVPCLT